MVAKPRSHITINCYLGSIRLYLIDRWGNFFAEEIEPSGVEQWFFGISRDARG